ncbi:MAG: hypothetical protein IV104_12970 [Acidovorax sp.]|nr:hypothetical protein [Acidovorax sp.]
MNKLRDWALKWVGTLLFLVWDFFKRVRGHLHRGEWFLLMRLIGVFFLVLALCGFAYGFVAGCLELGFHHYHESKK